MELNALSNHLCQMEKSFLFWSHFRHALIFYVSHVSNVCTENLNVNMFAFFAIHLFPWTELPCMSFNINEGEKHAQTYTHMHARTQAHTNTHKNLCSICMNILSLTCHSRTSKLLFHCYWPVIPLLHPVPVTLSKNQVFHNEINGKLTVNVSINSICLW